MLVVFDFDDTLVDSSTLKVPKQTYHMMKHLKKRNVDIRVVSYNRLLRYWIHLVELAKYVTTYATAQIDREKLVQMILPPELGEETWWYVDDREDHIETIRRFYPNAKTFHVKTPQTLFKFKSELFELPELPEVS